MDFSLNSLERYFHNDNVPFLKNDSSTTVKKITINNETFVIKRYNMRGFFYNIKRCLLQSRAIRAFNSGHKLLQYNIDTPLPIAAIEQRFGILRGKSYLITKYVDATDANSFLSNHDKQSVINSIVHLSKTLDKYLIVHGDPKLENILLQNNKAIAIDLDRTKFYSKRSKRYLRARKRDLKILMSHPKGNIKIRNKLIAALYSAI